LGEFRENGFDGNALAEFRVPRFVDLAHAAPCDESMNLKPAGNSASRFKDWGRFPFRRVGVREDGGLEEVSGLLVGKQKHFDEVANLGQIGAGTVEIGTALLWRLSKSCLKEILNEILRVRHCFHPALGRMRNAV
jgi:hypothetical protein